MNIKTVLKILFVGLIVIIAFILGRSLFGFTFSTLHNEVMSDINSCSTEVSVFLCRVFFNKPLAFLDRFILKFIEIISEENFLSFFHLSIKPIPTFIAYFAIIKIFSLKTTKISSIPNIKSKRAILLILVLIFSLGVFLRFYRLTDIPPGATLDEISIGYNAFTIATTGYDQDGRFLPVGHFRSLADYKLPLQIYIGVPFNKLFGNSLLAIRFPSALIGSLSILATFFLARLLFNSTVGLLSALFLAISPWHAFHSHLGLETNTGLFFAILTILFLQLSLKNQRHLLLSTLFFILSIYSHHIFWLFLPTLVIIFFYLNRDFIVRADKKIIIVAFAMVLFAVLPFFFAGNPGKRARIKQSLFSYENIASIARGAGGSCKRDNSFCLISALIVKLGSKIASQYMSAFSLIAWYGPAGFDLFDIIPNRGMFYYFELLLLFIGLVVLVSQKSKKSKFLLSWLLIYPLPIALTSNLSAARMYQLLPLPQIIEAYGLLYLWKTRKKIALVFIPIVLFSFIRFLPDFWFTYPTRYSRYTDYGAIAIFNYIKSNQDKTFYVQDAFFHKLHLLYFFAVPLDKIGVEDVKENETVMANYGNIFLVRRGFTPPPISNGVFISFKEDIPQSYKEFDTIFLKSGEPFAFLSSSDL